MSSHSDAVERGTIRSEDEAERTATKMWRWTMEAPVRKYRKSECDSFSDS